MHLLIPATLPKQPQNQLPFRFLQLTALFIYLKKQIYEAIDVQQVPCIQFIISVMNQNQLCCPRLHRLTEIMSGHNIIRC
jgi:hypothetical protein